MAFTSKSFTLARLLVLAPLCWACIHPMVSLATPTQEETTTFNALKAKVLKGCNHAMYELGLMYAEKKQYKLALYWTEKSAKNGDADGKVALGMAYLHGLGTAKNHKEALNWFEKASNQGYYWGSFFIAKMYQTGNGVPKNTEKAFEYYEKYALQGDWAHKDILGNMYLKEGGFLNFLKGWYWKSVSLSNHIIDLALMLQGKTSKFLENLESC